MKNELSTPNFKKQHGFKRHLIKFRLCAIMTSMNTIIDFFKRNRKKLTPYLITVVLALVTVLLALVTGHREIQLESRKCTSVLLAVISYGCILLYGGICIFLRIKRKALILKGLLLYQFIGLIAFVFHLMLLMAQEESGLYYMFTYIFYWWSLPYHQGALLAIGLFHFPVRYILMLTLAMLTYLTAKCLKGIRTDLAFEQKIEEKRQIQEQIQKEAQKPRIQTAKEAEEKNSGTIR